MLYNKLYIRAMAILLLLLIIFEAVFSTLIIKSIKENTLTIDYGATLLLIVFIVSIIIGVFIVGVFMINSYKNDRYINKKAVKEQDTYLFNEEALNYKINQVIELYNNYGIVHSILVIDLVFKGGNKVLYEAVHHIEQIIRKNDLLFRMDNGNFVVIANSNLQDAIGLGNKIIEELNQLGKELLDMETPIDTSIGITHTKKNDTKSSIINRIEKSLFAAIKYGRNRVEYMS